MSDYPEPLKTLVERQLHTAECERYVRSYLYNVLWHSGSQSLLALRKHLPRAIIDKLCDLPTLTFMEKIEFVEIAEHAYYRESFRSDVDWRPDTISMNVSDPSWLHDAIHERAARHMQLLMLHTADELNDNLLAIAKTCAFVNPRLVGGHDPDAETERLATGLDMDDSSLGTVCYKPGTKKIMLQRIKSLSLWMYEGAKQ